MIFQPATMFLILYYSCCRIAWLHLADLVSFPHATDGRSEQRLTNLLRAGVFLRRRRVRQPEQGGGCRPAAADLREARRESHSSNAHEGKIYSGDIKTWIWWVWHHHMTTNGNEEKQTGSTGTVTVQALNPHWRLHPATMWLTIKVFLQIDATWGLNILEVALIIDPYPSTLDWMDAFQNGFGCDLMLNKKLIDWLIDF